MNIKFTSITFLVAAIASISFSQPAAHAADGRGMRFDYAPNEFKLEQPTGHRGSRYAAPHAEVAPIAAGIAPKMKGFDDGFVSRPAPPPPAPVVAAAPIAKPSVSSQVSIPKPFASLFNPVKSDPGLVAAAPGQLPAFGAPNAQKLPTTPKAPALAHSTNTAISWTHKKPRPVAAIAAAPAFKMPATLHQGSGYTPGAAIPMSTNTGSSTSTAVSGKLMHK